MSHVRRILGILVAVSLLQFLLGPAARGATAAEPPPPRESAELSTAEAPPPPQPATVSAEEAQLRTDLAGFERALARGPEAALAFAEHLTGPARDLLMEQIDEARALVRAQQPALQRVPVAPPTGAEETAEAEAQLARDLEARQRALALTGDPEEGGGPAAELPAAELPAPAPPSPSSIAATLTVGNGCTYATLTAALAAANAGDTLLLEGGRTFLEDVTISKDLVLSGGYSGCASASTARTTLDGSGTRSVVIVDAEVTATLENLNITGGSTLSEGGGIRFAYGTGTGFLTLSNVEIYGNTAAWGGGLWVGPDAEVEGEQVEIYDNTATTYGGGVRLYGSRLTLRYSNVYNNAAPAGAGVHASRELGYSPVVALQSYADIYSNQALTGGGLGGGVYLRDGEINLTDSSDLYGNSAIYGGGAFVLTTTLTIEGYYSEIDSNTATDLGSGGGIYAMDSRIWLLNQASISNNTASGVGGGVYLSSSDFNSESGSVHGNTSGGHGGGIFATLYTDVTIGLGTYPCLGYGCSSVTANTSPSYGGGIYLQDSTLALDNTVVHGNTGAYGGGIYALNSWIAMGNNLVARNDATSGVGDGIRLNASTLSGAGNTIAYNDSTTAGGGQGIAAGGTGVAVTLRCSVIWGHAAGISLTGQDITYSDIQGGYTGTGNLNTDPLFVSVAGGNFHLNTASPVIDRCTYTTLERDIDGEVRPFVYSRPATPYDMGADEASVPRVGIGTSGCAYGTLQQAIDAAEDGDTIRVAAATFSENVDIIDKHLIIEGGYDATCSTPGAGPTFIDGSYHTDSTIDSIGSTLLLRDLNVTGGTYLGAGLYLSSSDVTLDATKVAENHGTYGGGAWIDNASALTLTHDSDIFSNSASLDGGGARVWGRLVLAETQSDIYDNTATNGGGISVDGGTVLLNGADMNGNQADLASGKGGAIYAAPGSTVTTTPGAWIYNGNEAYDGAGIYADGATLNLNGAFILGNAAVNSGGGIFLANQSQLTATQLTLGDDTASGGNTATQGAGLYALNSTAVLAATIYNNTADSYAGAIYADASVIELNNSYIGGPGALQANILSATGHRGAGLYFTNGTHATLDNTLVSSNVFQTTGYAYGGGLCIESGSIVTLTGSTVERHVAPSLPDGRGAGLYVSASTLTLDHSNVISNTAGSVGGGIRTYDGVTLRVLNGSTVTGNAALTYGGAGIHAQNSPVIEIHNSSLSDNEAATDGGAIYAINSTLALDRAVLDHNTAAKGGAIYQEGPGAQANVANTLIYANSVSQAFGAGIGSAGGAVTMTHTTIADNAGGAAYSQTDTTSAVSNSIAWGNVYGFLGTFTTAACNIDQESNAGLNVSPQFVSPGGGGDYHLRFASPARDACATGLSPDLDGVARPTGTGYDMGAYEYPYGVGLTPDRSGTTHATGTVQYTHTLANTGSTADAFTLTAVSGHGWSASVTPASPIALAAGASTPVTVIVTVPAGVAIGTVDTTVVTARSGNDSAATAEVVDTTTIGEPPTFNVYLPAALRQH